jgi:hypothetical protein
VRFRRSRYITTPRAERQTNEVGHDDRRRDKRPRHHPHASPAGRRVLRVNAEAIRQIHAILARRAA